MENYEKIRDIFSFQRFYSLPELLNEYHRHQQRHGGATKLTPRIEQPEPFLSPGMPRLPTPVSTYLPSPRLLPVPQFQAFPQVSSRNKPTSPRRRTNLPTTTNAVINLYNTIIVKQKHDEKLSLMTRGSLATVLQRCQDYWNGNGLCKLSGEDKQLLLRQALEWQRGDHTHVVALSMTSPPDWCAEEFEDYIRYNYGEGESSEFVDEILWEDELGVWRMPNGQELSEVEKGGLLLYPEEDIDYSVDPSEQLLSEQEEYYQQGLEDGVYESEQDVPSSRKGSNNVQEVANAFYDEKSGEEIYRSGGEEGMFNTEDERLGMHQQATTQDSISHASLSPMDEHLTVPQISARISLRRRNPFVYNPTPSMPRREGGKPDFFGKIFPTPVGVSDDMESYFYGKSLHEVFEHVITHQAFLGLIKLNLTPKHAAFSHVEDWREAGIRFVLFSEDDEKSSASFAQKLGLEMDWNCSISLDENAPKKINTSDEAPLPRGIRGIKHHLQHVDNVPFLVPMFCDATPNTSRQVVELFVDLNADVSATVGSPFSLESARNFSTGHMGIGIQPMIPNCHMCSGTTREDFVETSVSESIPHRSSVASTPLSRSPTNRVQRRVSGRSLNKTTDSSMLSKQQHQNNQIGVSTKSNKSVPRSVPKSSSWNSRMHRSNSSVLPTSVRAVPLISSSLIPFRGSTGNRFLFCNFKN